VLCPEDLARKFFDIKDFAAVSRVSSSFQKKGGGILQSSECFPFSELINEEFLFTLAAISSGEECQP
jgi:hypothetical protein